LLFLEADSGWTEAFSKPPRPQEIIRIVALFLLLGSVLTAYAAYGYPHYFLSLPQRAPELWLRVMIFYPLLSVTAQEMLFRVLFFHRFGTLFGEAAWRAIIANAALFAFAHGVLFAYRQPTFHWQAVAISFIGGLIFARRFVRSGSFWAVFAEHSLYGDLIFTIGLGVFFFTGVSSF
jgi:hypothetical protein